MRALLFLAAIVVVGLWLRSFFPSPRWDDPLDDGDLGPEFDGSEELVRLVSSADPVALDAYRGMLHGAGIPTVLFDEDASRMLGRTPAVAARLMIPASRLEEARALIDDLEPGTFTDPDRS